MSRPGQAVIKRLFAHSGNRCAFPKCVGPIVQQDTILGEICHIKAASPNGPRYDPEQTPEERHGYDNLILLCAKHHTVVDDDEEAYTVGRLRKMKADHESRSATLGDQEADAGAQLLFNQVVRSDNQSGGITAHTVNQTFHMHAAADRDEERRQADKVRLQSEARRTFRDERVGRIMARQTPVTLLNGGLLTLHVVPLGAFDSPPTFRLRDAAKMPGRFPTLLDTFTRQSQITVDGLLTTSNLDPPPKPQRAYTHVSRNGVVEAVVSSITRSDDCLILPQLEAAMIRYARVYMYGLRQLGGESPYAVFASVLRAKGKSILYDFSPQGALVCDLPAGRFAHDRYDFVESVFEDFPPDDSATARLLRATLDHLANAVGLPTSPYFDEAGNYTRRI